MEKTILISGQQVSFKTNGAVPKRYQMQFKRDLFKDLLAMGMTGQTEAKTELEAFQDIDFDLFYNLAWVLAKSADSTIPEPLTWLEEFETFPIMDILPELQEMLAALFSAK